MTEKQENHGGDRNDQPVQAPARSDQHWPWAPANLSRFCQALLTANTLEDVLHASVGVIEPTDISGVTILLGSGSANGRYLEVAASWQRNSIPPLPKEIQFSRQDYLFQSLSVNGQPVAVNDLTTDERVSEYTRSVLLQAQVKALVMLPLGSVREFFGALLVCRSEHSPFDEECLSLYRSVAELVQGVIEKLWLIRKNERALAKTSALYEISQRLSTAQNADDVLRFVINSELFGAAGGTIAVLDEPISGSNWNDRELIFRAAAGVGAEEILGMRMPVTEGVVGWVVRENEPATVPDAYADERFYHKMDQDIDFRTQSILCAPLRVENRVVGAFELVDVRPEYLGEEGIRLLSQLADQAALLIENQRLLDENRRLLAQTSDSLQETTLLYQAGRALTQAKNLPDVLGAITGNLPIEHINQCWIALIDAGSVATDDHDQRVTEIKAIWDHEGDHSLLGTRFSSRELPFVAHDSSTETMVISDLEHGPGIDTQSALTLRSLGAKSALIVPLITGESSLLGWLVLLTHHDAHAFGIDEIRPYQSLADQAAVAIRNQQLLQQVQDSLIEVETVHRQYLRREWTSYLQSKDEQLTAVAYDRGAVVSSLDTRNPLIEEAFGEGAPVTQPTLAQRVDENGTDDHQGNLLELQRGTNLITPLKVRGQVIGALGLEDPEHAREWTADELTMIQEIANRVAQAVENARLLEETQATLAETEHLYQATGHLSEAAAAKEVIEILAEEFCAALGPTCSGNILWAGSDSGGPIEWLEQRAKWNPEGVMVIQGARFATADYPALSRILGERQPTIITELDPRLEVRHPQNDQSATRPDTLLAIPLVVGENWLGVVNIIIQEGRAPDKRTVRFLQNLADRAAVALESARLYAETERRAIQLEAGAKVSRAATSILEQEKLLTSVVALIRDHFDYYHAQVFLLDPTGRWAVLEASTGDIGEELLTRGHALEVGGNSLIGQATAAGEPRQAYSNEDAALFPESTYFGDTRSELVIPLRIGGRVIGALDVHSTELDAFGPDDIAVLSTLADQLTIAIANARLYQEQLETAEKLREVDRLKTQFLANMSHELRTPLNSIIGFSRVILKGIDGPLTDLQKQDLTAIYHSGKLLLKLINDVLDISKIAAGKMDLAFEELDLREIITGVMSTATALVKEKPQIELRQNVPDDLPPIIADATRLRQVLLNLLSNAIKFTELGYIELSITHDLNDVTLQVTDTGIGIPPDKFDLIFQEFEQVDGSATRSVGGTGLGLPISRRFIELHGGRIWVESEVGVGSTFTVQLPIRGPSTGQETADETTIDSNRRLILAIDDDADVINFYKRHLERQRYQVLGVSESDEAIRKAAELHPHAILLDVLMRQKDGWTVIQELKSDPKTRDIPVILCSIVDAAGRGFSLGAADFLMKPVTEERLLAALSRLGDGVQRIPQAPRRVLIIDDTPEDRKLLRRTLESAGEPYHVIEADGGRAGIQAIHQQRPDIVVLDLMMPEVDGFAVLESLKRDAEMRKIPIIIVTAKDLTESERAQINGQVAALFQKGLFQEDEFFRDLDSALNKLCEPKREEDEKAN